MLILLIRYGSQRNFVNRVVKIRKNCGFQNISVSFFKKNKLFLFELNLLAKNESNWIVFEVR